MLLYFGKLATKQLIYFLGDWVLIDFPDPQLVEQAKVLESTPLASTVILFLKVKFLESQLLRKDNSFLKVPSPLAS